MSGRGIECLGKPALPFRVDRGVNRELSGFESIGLSMREDLLRARLLRKSADSASEMIDAEAARALATKLERSGDGIESFESLASSVYMRDLRINVAGGLWKLVEESGAKVRSFTIIPKNWEFEDEELGDVDPAKLLRGLRTALYSQGAAKASGWIYMYVHGEYDPGFRVYRLHVHGFAYGEMVDVIDRLRLLPNFLTQRFLDNGVLVPVYRRIRISRRRLTDLPRPITYRLQSYWPSKALLVADDGSRIRARRKRRIEEPYHSQVLLWFDRWTLSDLTLMIGLRVTKDGLKQTKPVS